MPLAVVIDEFVHVLAFSERTEKQMLQHRIVQDRDTGTLDGLPINQAVELIVADMVQVHVSEAGIGTDVAELLQGVQQSARIVRDAGARGRQRGMEAGSHAFFLRLPNSAVPTRTQVAPSSMATSISCDMPMDSPLSACF